MYSVMHRQWLRYSLSPLLKGRNKLYRVVFLKHGEPRCQMHEVSSKTNIKMHHDWTHGYNSTPSTARIRKASTPGCLSTSACRRAVGCWKSAAARGIYG